MCSSELRISVTVWPALKSASEKSPTTTIRRFSTVFTGTDFGGFALGKPNAYRMLSPAADQQAGRDAHAPTPLAQGVQIPDSLEERTGRYPGRRSKRAGNTLMPSQRGHSLPTSSLHHQNPLQHSIFGTPTTLSSRVQHPVVVDDSDAPRLPINVDSLDEAEARAQQRIARGFGQPPPVA